jgi:hypothetical protein
MTQATIAAFLIGFLACHVLWTIFSRREKKFMADLTAQFANLDKHIADAIARVAAGQANAIQPADVQAAADARAAVVDAIAPAPVV